MTCLYKQPNEHLDPEAQQCLDTFKSLIGIYTVGCGLDPAVITETWRPARLRTPSFHSKIPPQAFDLRTKDKPQWWLAGVLDILRALKKHYIKLQFDPHEELRGTENEHLHIEYDTGDPV